MLIVSSGCYFSREARRDRAFASGQKFLQENRPKEAQIQFQRAVNLDPNFAMAQYQLGSTSIALNDYRKAYQALTAAVKLRPMYFETNRDLAQVLLRSRRFKEARPYAQAALKIKPGDTQSLEFLADSYAGAGDLETAAKGLEDLVAHDPMAVSATMTLALVKLRTKDLSGAEETLKALTERKPTVRTLTALGNFYMSEGKLKEAEASLKKAVELEPKSADPLYQLGLFYMVTGHPDQAEPVFQKLSSEHQEDPRDRGALARFHYYGGQTDKGIADLQVIVKKYPDDKDSRNALLNALVETDRGAEAQALTEQILKKEPDDVPAHLSRGILFLRAEKSDQALADILEVLRREPASSVAHYYKAMAHLEQGSRPLAKQELGDALKYQPANLAARVEMIELLLQEGSTEAAQETIKETPASQAKSYAIYLEKARAEIAKYDYLPAELDLTALARARPKMASAYANLGVLYALQRRWKESRDNFAKTLELAPKNPIAIEGMYEVLIQTGEASVGETMYAKMAKDNPKSEAAAVGLAWVREAQHRDAQAEEGLQQFLTVVPNDVTALKMIADLRYKVGDTERAEAITKQIIKSHPDDPSAFVALASIYLSRKRYGDAVLQYREVLKRNPEDRQSMNNLAWLIVQTGGNVDEALALAQKAKEKQPTDPTIADTLGWIYLKKNNMSLALREFQDAVRGDPKNQEKLYHLGVAQYRTGKLRDAQVTLAKAVSGNPTYTGIEDARHILQTIQR